MFCRRVVETTLVTHHSALMGSAVRRCANWVIAEDALSKARVLALTLCEDRLRADASESDALQWVFGILRHCCLQARQEAKKCDALEDQSTEGGTMEVLTNPASKGWIDAALKHEALYKLRHVSLSPLQQQVLSLRLAGRKHEDIGASVGMSAEAVRKVLSRACQRVQRCTVLPAIQDSAAEYLFFVGSAVSVYRKPAYLWAHQCHVTGTHERRARRSVHAPQMPAAR